VTNADFDRLLARYPADCRPRAYASLGSGGGFSGAAIWKLETARGPLALRRWPPEHPTPERLAWIHAVAKHADIHGFGLLPQPIPTCDDGTGGPAARQTAGQTFVTESGRLFQLEPWLPGKADYLAYPSETRLAAAFSALARFHKAVETFPNPETSFGPSPGVIERRVRLAKLFAGELANVTTALASNTDARLAAIVELGHRTLALVPAAAARVAPLLEQAANLQVPLQPCLRDIWSDHVLFTGDEVAGIIDLGAMRIESVGTDIARLLGSMAGDDAAARQVAIATYTQVRELSGAELQVAQAIDDGNVVLSGILWLEWLLVERRKFTDFATIAARLQTGLTRLEHLVHSRPPMEGVRLTC
jgi:Ser/Thr protein kinase RdoA (MazF antagonist)